MSVLFPEGKRLKNSVKSRKLKLTPFDPEKALVESFPKKTETESIKQAIKRVFALPAVGSKSFLITIGDHTVGGMTVRDQMAGPWQTPVSDGMYFLSYFFFRVISGAVRH